MAGLGLVVVLLGGVALRVPPAIADAQKIEGKPVPDAELASVVAAATSCPTLTPARLAGQLMALTGFDTAVSGSSIAGVDDSTWNIWKPTANAERDDDQANILALAHQDCEYVGELRVASIDGDLFQLAVAAQHGSMDAVKSAKGIPSADKSYVDQVSGYAAWYADSDQFNVQAAASASPSVAPEAAVAGNTTTSTTPAVPADLVDAIDKAGKTCEEVTPARIAAQLKAASDFDANLRTDAGEGIAQFSPTMWAEYASSKQSVWNANDAIGVLGEAMCDLTNQFSGFTGTDPWEMALGAFQWGTDTVRQAGGLPKSTVAQLATTAEGYMSAMQTAMGGDKTTASASPSPSVSTSSSPSASPSPSNSQSAAPATSSSPSSAPATKPTTKALYDPAKTYQLQDAWAGAILELPGTDLTNTPSGTRVQLWNNLHQKDQYWAITPVGTTGFVSITNKLMNLALSVENNSADNQSKLVVTTIDTTNHSQLWKITDAGDGKVFIQNYHSGKVMDLLGDDLAPPNSDGTWNGYLVEQWDKQSYAKDQRWILLAS